MIETQQRHHTELLNHILLALEKCDNDDSCELPDGWNLPVQSVTELLNVDKLLKVDQNAKLLVIYTSFGHTYFGNLLL